MCLFRYLESIHDIDRAIEHYEFSETYRSEVRWKSFLKVWSNPSQIPCIWSYTCAAQYERQSRSMSLKKSFQIWSTGAIRHALVDFLSRYEFVFTMNWVLKSRTGFVQNPEVTNTNRKSLCLIRCRTQWHVLVLCHGLTMASGVCATSRSVERIQSVLVLPSAFSCIRRVFSLYAVSQILKPWSSEYFQPLISINEIAMDPKWLAEKIAKVGQSFWISYFLKMK